MSTTPTPVSRVGPTPMRQCSTPRGGPDLGTGSPVVHERRSGQTWRLVDGSGDGPVSVPLTQSRRPAGPRHKVDILPCPFPSATPGPLHSTHRHPRDPFLGPVEFTTGEYSFWNDGVGNRRGGRPVWTGLGMGWKPPPTRPDLCPYEGPSGLGECPTGEGFSFSSRRLSPRRLVSGPDGY